MSVAEVALARSDHGHAVLIRGRHDLLRCDHLALTHTHMDLS